MADATDIAIAVEDPGAANFVAFLPDELQKRGISSRLFACGRAVEHLSRFSKICEILPQGNPESILNQIKPRCVLGGTSANLDSPVLGLIRAARNQGISTVGVVDALMNADMRFRGRTENPLEFAPDWLLVPSRTLMESFVGLGFAADRIRSIGTPHFDFLKKQRTLLEGNRQALRNKLLPEAGNRPVFLFAAEASVRTKQQPREWVESYELRGSGSPGRTETILEELRAAFVRTGCKPYFIIRVHPRDTPDDYASFLDIADEISHGGDPYELISAVDCVLGITSMMLLESVMLGRPTLAVIPRRVETEWLPTISA
ncbi:MAG: hypothetical protein K8S54_13700, partial [Spirochaetia bacterium]|nr:hypothetical protein [Spirochaetia bacterium]